MPLFYFDVDDGERVTLGRDALDLADRAAARREAISSLPSIVNNLVTDSDTRAVTVTVRDRARNPVYHASLTLVGKWLA